MEKDHSIESLRGVAIILVLGLHISGDAPLQSVQEFYNYIAYTFQNVRIPLFTVISGYLYSIRPAEKGLFCGFLQGKARRIILPFLVVATAEYLATSLAPGVNNPTPIQGIWNIFIFPYEHYWFLQAIFVVFIVTGFVDINGWLNNFRRWAFIFSLTLIPFLFFPSINFQFLAIGPAFYILPFFILGIGLNRYQDKLFSIKYLRICGAVFLFSFLLHQFLWVEGHVQIGGKRTALGLSLSVSACILLFYIRRPIWGLKFIGTYAFSIYLYQGFGTAIGRRIGEAFSIEDPHSYFLIVLSIGIFVGIIAEMIFRKSKALRPFMLGLK
jgi:surface polysaccharide O-acyltransferase-like enzyme